MKKSRIIVASFVSAASLGLILTGCVSAQPPVTEHAVHSRMGSHGMAVIGKSDLLLHHMPLYRAPHDRQILTPAVFADQKDRIAFDKWRQSYAGLVSIVPENFDLARLDPASSNAITSFTADVYQGHFERGGEIIFKAVQFQLGRPVFHRPVTEKITSAQFYTYLENGNEAFIVGDIDPRPGTDQILAVTLDQNLKSGERLELLKQKSKSDKKLSVKRDDKSVINITIGETLYLEQSDFQSIE